MFNYVRRIEMYAREWNAAIRIKLYYTFFLLDFGNYFLGKCDEVEDLIAVIWQVQQFMIGAVDELWDPLSTEENNIRLKWCPLRIARYFK